MALKLEKLHPLYVAEVSDIDLTHPLDDATITALRDAFNEHSILVFRDQDITDAEQIAFSERFGPLERMLIGSQGGGTPIAILSNVEPATDRIIPPDDKRMIRNICNEMWHTDSSFKRVPSLASILSGREVVSDGGGETQYATLRGAYDALPEETKVRIEGLVAEHSFAYSRSLVDPTLLTQEMKDEVPPVLQSMVRQNPENGRKALYLGSHASHILGMPVEEGRALLRELLEHVTQEKFLYTHKWRPKDIVMWDNRAVLHRGRPYDYARTRRVMHRTTVAGLGPTVEDGRPVLTA
jgi:alpha-ketoglutarate-dependent 2,4-dichlorophenoxyacetate dioxygenase